MTKEIFFKRLKSFLWRSLVVFALGALAWFTGILPELNLPEILVTLLGLIVNECTKLLNSNLDLFGKIGKKLGFGGKVKK